MSADLGMDRGYIVAGVESRVSRRVAWYPLYPAVVRVSWMERNAECQRGGDGLSSGSANARFVRWMSWVGVRRVRGGRRSTSRRICGDDGVRDECIKSMFYASPVAYRERLFGKSLMCRDVHVERIFTDGWCLDGPRCGMRDDSSRCAR